MKRHRNTDLVIWTVGHSTRPFEEFFGLLAEDRIERLADVRRFPASKRVPWATQEPLAAALRERGVDYEHFEDLGGFRKPIAGGGNSGWRNAGFRGYADYMASSDAEAVPWKCHRSLLADSLVARGVRVEHILSLGKTEEHHLTTFASIEGSQVTYPRPYRGA